jgi:hypothetical protein
MEALLAAPRVAGFDDADLAALAARVRGPVYNRGHAAFAAQTRLWNGNILCQARALACPIDAGDVAQCVPLRPPRRAPGC